MYLWLGQASLDVYLPLMACSSDLELSPMPFDYFQPGSEFESLRREFESILQREAVNETEGYHDTN